MAWDLALLIALVVAIGVASSPWHLLTPRWAALADEVTVYLALWDAWHGRWRHPFLWHRIQGCFTAWWRWGSSGSFASRSAHQ